MRLGELKIEVTNRCPLKCMHCSTGSESGLRSLLSLSDIKRLIGQAYDLGCRKIFFSGGEPLFYPYIESLIEHCHSKRLETKLYSTGIESDQPFQPIGIERLRYLNSRGLESIAFSLYASEHHIHDLITDSPGSFIATATAIQNAVLAGMETEVHFVATRLNIGELARLSDFLSILGVKRISVLRFVPQGRGKYNSEGLIPTDTDFLKLREIIVSIRQRSQVSLRLGSPFNFLLLGSPSACTSGRDRMIIDAHGLAHPCDALKQVAFSDRFNNALITPLKQIMDKDSLFSQVRQLCTSPECKACPDFKICRGGCLAQAILSNGGPCAGRDPACLRILGEGADTFESI